ncbi:hypothetical protein ACFOLD_00995 [Kocuria carniphila]|uniref:hypothetical protein n=1 Tax=Kocuria carniphila TaxID=262208 RepID=UPI003622B96D
MRLTSSRARDEVRALVSDDADRAMMDALRKGIRSTQLAPTPGMADQPSGTTTTLPPACPVSTAAIA